MSFPTSPGVKVSEIDLTTSIPAVSVSTGAFAGVLNWGPANTPTQVVSEVDFNNKFGTPDYNTATSFLTCTSFLAYSSDLLVVRACNTATMNNSTANAASNANTVANGSGLLIQNDLQFFNNQYNTVLSYNPWAARFPGRFGNSLTVYSWANGNVWTANATNTADPLYTFANYFDRPPGTSPYVTSVTGSTTTNDEIHILVVDTGGLLSGTANTILEKYEGLSVLSDALNPTGGSNFFRYVIYNQSDYVHSLGYPSANVSGWGTQVLAQATIAHDANANVTSLAGGTDGVIQDGDIETALSLFGNKETTDISLLFTGSANAAVQSYAIGTIAANRMDCVAFCSPPLSAVQSSSGPAAAIVNYVQNNGLYYSSYGVFDSGWKYMYDKYNDIYRWVPLNGDIAGLCAATDNIRDPWWSPAGLQRGVIKNLVKLAYTPNYTDRNTLYKAGVNPVTTFPGEGTVLFGDKTFLNYSSAFDRINVRRLFIVLEKTISKAARSQLFEFNDTFTRASFVNLVTPFLRTVKGRRGITDFQVVCDTTNNTPDIIDANQFVGDIYIKPARSINYIQLNFIAVRTGVSFNEIVGTQG